ncbi:hypothetical protein SPRG_19582 [Saprolegnia parasitica CBS 223.65]|uniref:Ribosomal RNA large subunit methyltransferase K/L-like methyltransferase domain-containing protein n=1 Tax=Saprolegnia parasitica (strain CBS 223.65) TaxID=695850 RepID=A0A067CJZ0_SAPPC|nr:hypothetical protein SPRG_19582 [Saprolegnia parasitica CBS 223.65]KDO31054.1 hypothetical protein SPRG_19582 [Saprolegnia parasitica CBS 223.65]|eukprot:XP_012198315.1 hypothetical protein SPRG_19582 [Saprolegnia parasitica CBS 223.65]
MTSPERIQGRVVARRYHGKTLSFCTLLVRHTSSLDLATYKDHTAVNDETGLPVQVCFEATRLEPVVAPWLAFPAAKRAIVHSDEVLVDVMPHVNAHGRAQLLVLRWRFLDTDGVVDPVTAQHDLLESRLAKASAILHHFVALPKRLHPIPARLSWFKTALPGAAVALCCGILSHQDRIALPTAAAILSTSWTLLATQDVWAQRMLPQLPPLPEAEMAVDAEVCRLFATVPGGFQDVAAGELIEKVDAFDIELLEGKVVFSIPLAALPRLRSLRSIEKLYVLLLKASDLLASAHVLGQLQHDVPAVVPRALLEHALDVYQAFHNLDRRAQTFRVTLRLSGVAPMSQLELAQALAAGMPRRFHLSPELKGFDVEIFSHVQYPPPYTSGSMLLGLSLLRRTMAFDELGAHVGNGVSATGRQLSLTTLRPTIATILVDPMCGCGTIPEMAAKHFSGQLVCIAGDYADAAIERAAHNAALASAANPNLFLDVVQWDCRRLPIRRDFVDALVTDMPFGKRIGSHAKNNGSYPEILHEFCRVTKKGTGHAVLLTTERELLAKQLGRYKTWIAHRQATVNVGGLDAKCFHLSYL